MANIFPRWTNYLPLKIIFCLLVVGGAVSAVYWYYLTPEYMRAGYQPVQPVPFSHDIHVTQLGMDCRYCHSYVEVSSHSNVPTTQTCMNCHTAGASQQSKTGRCPGKLAKRESGRLGENPPGTRFRLFQSLSARQSGHQLRELPRSSEPHGCGLPKGSPLDGLVLELPSASRK